MINKNKLVVYIICSTLLSLVTYGLMNHNNNQIDEILKSYEYVEGYPFTKDAIPTLEFFNNVHLILWVLLHLAMSIDLDLSNQKERF